MTDSPRRIIVISPDPVIGRSLIAALAGVGAPIELRSSAIGVDQAALCVLHVAHETAELPRLPAPTVLALHIATLDRVARWLETATWVVGSVAVDDLDAGLLAATVRRILADDLFGLEQVLGPDAEINTLAIGEYSEKVRGMEAAVQYAAQSGAPARIVASIELCLDEMLMNALYDAPVDANGTHIFAGVAPRTRVTQRTAEDVILQYGHDGRRFAIAVRDAYGSLDRLLLARYLSKCLHEKQSMDRKAGGAGVGLYLVLNSASVVYFHVLPQIATEVVCVFDTVPSSVRLGQVAFAVQTDRRGLQPARPAQALPARTIVKKRATKAALATLLVAALGTVGVLAWRAHQPREPARISFHTVPDDVTIEIDGRTVGAATGGTYTTGGLEPDRDVHVVGHRDGFESSEITVHPHPGDNAVALELRALATVALDSEPTSSSVEIDGKPIGMTPLAVTSLRPGTTVAVVFRHRGYRDATAHVRIPKVGETTRLVEPLVRSEDFVRVRFVSDPPGAEVLETGAQQGTDRTYTPAELFVEAGKLQRFTLTMPGHVPLVIDPFTPERGGADLQKGGTLREGATLHVQGATAARISVVGAPHCQNLPVPADCVLAPGTYEVTVVGAGAPRRKTIVIAAADVVTRLD